MILNDQEYKITKAQVERFATALEAAKNAPPSGLHPKIVKARTDSLQSMLAELQAQVRAYEKDSG